MLCMYVYYIGFDLIMSIHIQFIALESTIDLNALTLALLTPPVAYKR